MHRQTTEGVETLLFSHTCHLTLSRLLPFHCFIYFFFSSLTKVGKVESVAGPLTQPNTSETQHFAIRN